MKPYRMGLALAVLGTSVGLGADWPQWRGVNRDGRSPETGLLKTWPSGGPQQLWSARGLGQGFSSVAVANGVIYTTGLVGRSDVLSAIGLDGKLKWRKSYGPGWASSHPGARSTPTVDGELVYVMSGLGTLACFEAQTGEKRWSVNTIGNRRAIPRWGIAESVLVVGSKVICTPGEAGGSIVALDRADGSRIWQSRDLSEKSGYCSPILLKRGRQQLIVTMLANSIVCVDLANGRRVWRHPHSTRYDVHAVTPVAGDDYVYATSGYGTGGVLLALSRNAREVTSKWRDRTLDTHHGGVVLVDGKIYGTRSRTGLVRLDAKTGQVDCEARRVSKGSIIYADGLLYVYTERGTVGLVEPTPDEFKLVGRLAIREGGGPHWAHPAISDGRLYVRHGDVLMAYDIRAR